MKLLIADDNAAMRQWICSVVADLADTIFECSNGAEAVAAYAEQHPDWVLMDLMMPVMDGLQATAKIKAMEPQARIAIVTSHNDARLRNEATKVGADAFIPKDQLFDLRYLIQTPKENYEA